MREHEEKRISIVVPASGSSRRLREVVDDLRRISWGTSHEILVCPTCDVSELDGTFDDAERDTDVVVVDAGTETRLADAYRAGIARSTGDLVVMLGPELVDPVDAIPELAARLKNENLDCVVGSRFAGGGRAAGMPFVRRLLARTYGLLTGLTSPLGTNDPTSSIAVYRRSFLRGVQTESTVGSELRLELLVKASERGLRVAQVPIVQTALAAEGAPERVWRCIPRYGRWAIRPLVRPALLLLLVLALSWFAVDRVTREGRNVPRWDEWSLVDVVAGERALSLEWLWAPHNEHRFPLARLAYVSVFNGFGRDFRAGMYVNVALLALSSLVLLYAANRARGSSSLTDAIFPLVLLHWGHADTFLWSFQIGFALSTFFFCCLLATWATARTVVGPARFVIVSLLSIGLPLVGGSGFLLALGALFWLLFHAAFELKAKRKAGGWTALAGTILVLGGLAAYAFGIESARLDGETARDITGMLATARDFLTVSLGAATRFVKAPAWILVAAVSSASLLGLAWTFFRRKSERSRSLGLICGFIGMGALALGIGLGRSTGGGADVGLSHRYVTLAAPLLCLVQLVCAGRLGFSGLRFVGWVLLIGVLAITPRNYEDGLRRSANVSDRLQAYEVDAWSGMSPARLAATHSGSEGVYPKERFLLKSTERLQSAALGPFGTPNERRRSALRRYYTRKIRQDLSRPWLPFPLESDSNRARIAYLSPAPGQIEFDVPPGKWKVSGGFGLREDSWKNGKTDGVHFRVRALEAGEKKRLFGRFLNPVELEEDRTDQSFSVVHEASSDWTLLLLTEAGDNKDYAWDWSWWSDLSIEPVE